MPSGAGIVARLVHIVEALHTLIVDGERACTQRRMRDLQELVELKSAFLRLTTHELRRPLALTNGYLSMILDGTWGEMPEALRQPARHLEAGIQEMAALVDSLAVVARIEDRGEALHLTLHRIGQLAAEAAQAVEGEAAAKGIRIEASLPSPDPEIAVDADRLRIALVNLLVNAIKYSPEGSTVTIATRPPTSGEVAVEVGDAGPGIDSAEAESVFLPWHRAPGTSVPGLGLGLYIVRLIAELHGGRVLLTSTPSRGSAFTIVLPVQS